VIKEFKEDGIYTTYCDLVDVGQLNNFRRIKKIVCDITSTQINLIGGLISQHGRTSLEFFEQGQN
jgi:hypothetical protein